MAALYKKLIMYKKRGTLFGVFWNFFEFEGYRGYTYLISHNCFPFPHRIDNLWSIMAFCSEKPLVWH